MERFVDTHCHLNFDLFAADLDQVLERAWAAGLDRILVPGIDLATSRQVVELSRRDHRLYAAVGVHPNEARSWEEDTLVELRRLAALPQVIAIGEIGLDFYRDRAPGEIQRKILHEQLNLADELDKPVLIHSRESLSELWPILKDWQGNLSRRGRPLSTRCGVLHSYDGSREIASEAIAHHFYIGIGGPVTFHNAADRQKLAASLPLEGLLLETDAPFLAPQPQRGRRNEPAFIPIIAAKIADLQSRPLAEVAETTTRNSNRLLGWRSDL